MNRSSDHPPSPESNILSEPVDFDVRRLGRRLPRIEAPEGWVKRIDRRRVGKVSVGSINRISDLSKDAIEHRLDGFVFDGRAYLAKGAGRYQTYSEKTNYPWGGALSPSDL
jgi:hypothetical protein